MMATVRRTVQFRIRIVNRATLNRRGATLTEVLMAVMLMGIGVVTLAVLFPISILRSIQASQQTNATILRYNAESRIAIDPRMVFDPDLDGDTTEHIAEVDYHVDPLGVNVVSATLGALNRYDYNRTTEVDAAALVTLPDSWIAQAEAVPTVSTATSVTMPASIDLTGISTTTPRSRVLLFSNTGRGGHARTVSSIATQDVNWSANLPGGFGVEKVRIETQDRRYTWMLSVRNSSASGVLSADVDVVVFFNRAFRPDDEFEYTLATVANGFDGQPGVAGFDDDGDTTVDEVAGEQGFLGSDDNRTVTVTWASGTDPDPFLSKGKFLLESSTANWYRIVDMTDSTTSPVTLLLDQELVGGTANTGILLPGIVDVYPLGTITQ